MKHWIVILVGLLFTAACAAAPETPARPSPTPARPARTPTADAVPAQLAAIKTLAAQAGVPLAQIRVVSTTPVEWPDGCLGLPATEAACPAGVTPGYQILLEAGGVRHLYHTDQAGRQVREAPTEARLTWHREGGVAGFCDVLTVTTAGAAEAGACNTAPAPGQLTDAELAQLRHWAADYGAVVIVIGDPGTVDSLLTSLEMNGLGTGAPTALVQQQMLDWAQAVYTRLKP